MTRLKPPYEAGTNRNGLLAHDSANVEGRISTSQLTRMWASKFGLDVRRFFSTAEVQLKSVSPYNYYRFEPARSGDATFYSLLMRQMGYEHSEKAEFKEAARQIAPTDRVLDVGCGTGNFSDRCPGVYRGVDTNPAAVEDAGKLGRNVAFGLVEKQEPNSYDVVTVFQVLEHVDDPREFVLACVNCLRPGGLLIVSTPNMNGIMGFVVNDILNYPPHHMSWWSESSLKALVSDCGCDPVGIWQEPLRRDHLRTALSALFMPRAEKHLDTSLLFLLLDIPMRLLARIASRKWLEIPFITGHTLMIVASKQMGAKLSNTETEPASAMTKH